MTDPRPIARLTMEPGTLPLTKETRLWLAEVLSVYAAELEKGEHVNTENVVFYEPTKAWPALMFRTNVEERRESYRL